MTSGVRTDAVASERGDGRAHYELETLTDCFRFKPGSARSTVERDDRAALSLALSIGKTVLLRRRESRINILNSLAARKWGVIASRPYFPNSL